MTKSIREIREEVARNIYREVIGDDMPPIQEAPANLVIRYEVRMPYTVDDDSNTPTLLGSLGVPQVSDGGETITQVWRAALRVGRLPNTVLDFCREQAKEIKEKWGLDHLTMLVYPVWHVGLGLEFCGGYYPIYLGEE